MWNKAGRSYLLQSWVTRHFVEKVEEEKPTPEPQPQQEPQPSPVDPVSPVNPVHPVAPVTPTTPTSQPENPVTPAQPAASETKEGGKCQTSRCHLSYGWPSEVAATSNGSSKNRSRRIGFPQSLASLA